MGKTVNDDKNLHTGHFSRLRERYLSQGIDSLEEHVVLELLLHYAYPQRDVNELAHKLINDFGCLSAVFDAPVEELISKGGISENCAVLLKLVIDAYRVYQTDKREHFTKFTNIHEVGEWLKPKFIGVTNEVVYLICLDGKLSPLSCNKIFVGSVNSSQLDFKSIVASILAVNASVVVIAHNHPGGLAVPSKADVETTEKLKVFLEHINIRLLDHLIFDDNDFVSLAQSDLLPK